MKFHGRDIVRWCRWVMLIFLMTGIILIVKQPILKATDWETVISPEAGTFLYSVPELSDANFFHTVILMVTYDKTGAFGVVINRPTKISVDEALPDLEGKEDLKQPVYFGGPVSRERVSMIIRMNKEPEGSVKVLKNIFFTWNREALNERLKIPDADKDIRLYSGYAGWGPGQLDREIHRGDWVVARAVPEMIFSDNPGKVWPEIFNVRDKIEVHNRLSLFRPVSFRGRISNLSYR